MIMIIINTCLCESASNEIRDRFIDTRNSVYRIKQADLKKEVRPGWNNVNPNASNCSNTPV